MDKTLWLSLMLIFFKENNSKDVKKDENETEEHYMAKYLKVGIKLFAESEQLKGPLRFAADDFFREDQCLSLADLAKVSS